MNYAHTLKLTAASLVLAAASSSLQAETIVSYDISNKGDNANTSVAGAAPNAGITAGALTVGADLAVSSSSYFVFTGWGDDAQGALSDAYFAFTFDVANGTSVDLTNLTYEARSSGTGPGTMGLYWDNGGDNFSTLLGSFDLVTNENFAVDINLISAATIVGSGQTIEFRLIEVGNERANGGGSSTNDAGTAWIRNSLTLNGTVTVPEPGTYALLAGCLALTSVMVRRRR